MNNFLIASSNTSVESEPTNEAYINRRKNELAEIISAIEAVKSSSYWKLLEDRIWNLTFVNLQRRLREEKDIQEIYKLQGEIKWAEKYLNLDGLANSFRKELSSLTKNKNGKNSSSSND